MNQRQTAMSMAQQSSKKGGPHWVWRHRTDRDRWCSSNYRYMKPEWELVFTYQNGKRVAS